MLALLVALSLSQVTPDSRVTRVERVPGGRMEGGRGGVKAWAFFEAFPLGGAGVGSVAPYPNWLLQSEGINTAQWLLNDNTGSGVPVVTADQAQGADGTLTADKVDLKATSGATFNFFYQNLGSYPAAGSPVTVSIYVQGVSGSGTIDISHNGGSTNIGTCAFTTALTRCTVSTTALVGGAITFGNNSLANGGVARPAQSIYVWGAMMNVGSSAATYVQTTSAYATRMPTGAKGETLTFSRTGTAMATRTATGGLATTGIANGDLVLMPANAPRVEYDSAGTLGLLVESARTNSALRSEELDNAVWVKDAPVTRTANYATAPDGASTAERIQTAGGAGSESVLQTLGGVAIGTYTFSVFMRANTGSPQLYCYVYQGGGSPNAVTAVTLTTGSHTRCTVTLTTTAVTSVTFGVGYNTTISMSAVASDFLAWGAQFEAGAYVTSYIPTTSAAVARNAETAYFDLGAGSPLRAENMSMAITSVLAGLNPGIQGVLNVNAGSYGATSGADSMWAYFSSGGSVRCLASTSAATGTVALVTTPARTWCSSTVSSVNGSSNGVAMSAGGAPTAGAQPARWVNVGASPFPYSNDGIFSRVCVDTSSTRCR